MLHDRVLDADSLAGFSAAAPWLRQVEILGCTLREGGTSALCSFLDSLQTADHIILSDIEGCNDATPLLKSISHLSGTLQTLSINDVGKVR